MIAIAGLLNQLSRAEGNPHIASAAALDHTLFGETRAVEVRALVAVEKSIPIATAIYYRGYDVTSASYGYHLADFVVDLDHRRTGLGRELFTQLAAQNLAEGGEWVSLTALSSNAAAKAFYGALGLIHVPVDFLAIGAAGLRQLVHR